MSMQTAPARAEIRKVHTYDSIFRPKRQAYPAHCNCNPTPPSCKDGPPGPPGPPGHDGRMKEYLFHQFTKNTFFFIDNGDPGPDGHPGNSGPNGYPEPGNLLNIY